MTTDTGSRYCTACGSPLFVTPAPGVAWTHGPCGGSPDNYCGRCGGYTGRSNLPHVCNLSVPRPPHPEQETL